MLRVFRGSRPLMAAAKGKAKKAAPASEEAPAVKKRVQKPIPVSAALQKFVGQPEMSRTEVLKRVWDYAKLQNLQNPSDKREILCDEKLKSIFHGKDKVGMMEIFSLLAPHFLSPKDSGTK